MNKRAIFLLVKIKRMWKTFESKAHLPSLLGRQERNSPDNGGGYEFWECCVSSMYMAEIYEVINLSQSQARKGCQCVMSGLLAVRGGPYRGRKILPLCLKRFSQTLPAPQVFSHIQQVLVRECGLHPAKRQGPIYLDTPERQITNVDQCHRRCQPSTQGGKWLFILFPELKTFSQHLVAPAICSNVRNPTRTNVKKKKFHLIFYTFYYTNRKTTPFSLVLYI